MAAAMANLLARRYFCTSADKSAWSALSSHLGVGSRFIYIAGRPDSSPKWPHIVLCVCAASESAHPCLLRAQERFPR